MRNIFRLAPLLSLAMLAAPSHAADSPFHPGSVLPFGKIASVDSDMPMPPETVLKVRFDVSDKGPVDGVNRNLESVARFINMNAEAGVKPENIHVAIVLHGGASGDVTRDSFYSAKNDGKPNPNAALIAALLEHGTQIYLCGQSAAGNGISKSDLLPGVKMALSAMTAHALLAQQGYSLNPF